MFYQGREDPLTFTVVEYKIEYKGSGKELGINSFFGFLFYSKIKKEKKEKR